MPVPTEVRFAFGGASRVSLAGPRSPNRPLKLLVMSAATGRGEANHARFVDRERDPGGKGRGARAS